ncbi:MAG: hypothetical protein IJ358_00315 [Clostridia bacterium]|nr:hypothetical protein [Clostridia bacterium]
MKIPHKFSYSLIEPIKKHRAFVSFIIILTGVCIFCAVMAGIKFSNSSLLISFSNVVIVKFLRGSTGFGGMLFTNLFTIGVFAIIIICSCCKKYTISIGIFFYGYYVYAQSLTLIAFILEYGIINTLVVAFCMLLFMAVTLFLLLELFLICIEFQNEPFYFKCAISNCFTILIMIIILLILQSIIFFVLRNYIIVLVY